MSVTVKVDSLVDTLRARIHSGEFGDEKLPSFRELATEYQTTQETMNKAMQALQAEGALISRGTKGVFVNKQRIRVPGMVANFYEEYLKLDTDPIQVLITKPRIIQPSKELAKRMQLTQKDKILERVRKQGTKDITFRLVYEYFPMSLITPTMLEEIYNDPHYHIINAIKENFEKTIQHTHEELIARLPTLEEQKELQIVRTNPVIYTELTHFTEDKKLVICCNNKTMNANQFLLTYDYSVNYWNK